MMNATPIVVESQLDWLTCAVHDAYKQGLVTTLASELQTAEKLRGNDVHRFRIMGYYGWRCGRVRWGERGSAALVQLSGDLARSEFNRFYPLADSVTRLDLAVTVDRGQCDADLGRRAYAEADAHYQAKPAAARPSGHFDADGGWTTYVGNRASDWYLRIYNKEAECHNSLDPNGAGDYRNCWRYELEVKGAAAPVLAKRVYGTLPRSQWLRQLMATWLQDHGITPGFPTSGDVVHLSGLRRRSDRDSRMQWLGRMVAPSVRWLLDQGDRDAVLQVLGLEELPSFSPPSDP